jgi:hypothetical protein
MKKFSKILENQKSERYYKVSAQIELLVIAANEGEASYLGDSILSSVTNKSEYIINNLEEITEEEFKTTEVTWGEVYAKWARNKRKNTNDEL